MQGFQGGMEKLQVGLGFISHLAQTFHLCFLAFLRDITLHIGNGDNKYCNIETKVYIVGTFTQRKYTKFGLKLVENIGKWGKIRVRILFSN